MFNLATVGLEESKHRLEQNCRFFKELPHYLIEAGEAFSSKRRFILTRCTQKCLVLHVITKLYDPFLCEKSEQDSTYWCTAQWYLRNIYKLHFLSQKCFFFARKTDGREERKTKGKKSG